MSDRVPARGVAPQLSTYASGLENAPPHAGPAPDSSRGPPAVADFTPYRCAQEPRDYAPQQRELSVRGAMPTFQYKAASAPPEAISYDISQVSQRNGLQYVDLDQARADVADPSLVRQSGERDLRSEQTQNCNGGIDYQFLEQNISHQSILNQSISILNRQVGARNGLLVNSVQQLVQTPDGVVVAVVPVGLEPETASSEVTSREIIVPIGWKRIVNNTSVVYISPSGCALTAQAQLRDYLQTAGTCKCGLQCPLRPEAAFSFDPKVASKPYQVPPGGDLTKLCNHKRKLLATLQASQPTTPPPPPSLHLQHNQSDSARKGMTVEVGMLKKKIKKKTTLQPGVSMSQLLAHRERAQQGWVPPHEMPRDMVPTDGRTMSPHAMPMRNNSQSCPPAINMIPPNMADHADSSPNVQASHYLTVNPINPAQRVVSGYPNTPIPGGNATIGQPVLGTNGQIIGVHTGGGKIDGHMRNAAYNQHFQERKKTDDRHKMGENREILGQHGGKEPSVGDNGHVNLFCGLNQVPPGFVQKIDQQQQIFIQQNQKQIQMAMKGIRAQANSDSLHKNPYNNQQIPPGQLVIQNGAVINGNQAKTPPWQMKRTDTSPGPVCASNPSPTGSHHSHRLHCDQANKDISDKEDPSQMGITGGDNFNLLHNFEQNMNQMMQSRVPPLHMNYQQTVLLNEPKKKTKQSPTKNKKKINVLENTTIKFGTNGMREITNLKTNPSAENTSPSFMDDPSGYLAQQTALLNNTISRQVGSNNSFESSGLQSQANVMNHHATNHNMSNQNQSNQDISHRGLPQRGMQMANQTIHNQNQKDFHGPPNSMPPQQNVPHEPLANMEVHDPHQFVSGDVNQQSKGVRSVQLIKNMMPQHRSPIQNNIPDSSMISEKLNMESTPMQCCQGCNESNPSNFDNHQESLRLQYNLKQQYHDSVRTESDILSNTSSPNHGFDDNPVTSSTFLERCGGQGGPVFNDSRGPIQGGTVSTSHVSPPDQASLPEPSPTHSNSSRSADTPHSNHFLAPSPARSNPATPTPGTYNSPGLPNQSMNVIGSQMINFISNHNVNRNLMEVENISFTGANAIVKGPVMGAAQQNDHRRQISNSMLIPGYCPPPHLGGGPPHSHSQTNYMQNAVTTMASGHSVIRDTITSVLAGKAQTATTSINRATANFVHPNHQPNLSNSYAIPPNHPDPFLNSVNIPTSYPLHIAGTVAQNIINRNPLEMVQNVVSNINNTRQEFSSMPSTTVASQSSTRNTVHSGQILISSTGQIIVPNHNTPMPPPAPKAPNTSGNSQTSSVTTNVSPSVSQVVPAVGGVQQVINQPTVLVNTLPAPFVLQPQMMTVDGQMVQHNTVLPQIVAGGLPHSQSSNDSHSGEGKPGHGIVPRVALLSPESAKKKGKKRKSQNLTNVLHIAAPQHNTGGVLLHHASPQQSPQFSPRSFQLSPNSMSSAPMLQALTIVPGKSGTPAHIVMNGQGVANNFGSQQIITNTSPTQQINLLQPVNLINNASGVVPNFPTFQQFIVPNIGGMVMTADGTAIIQDSNTGMPMQLQLQNVNGQNVFTPIQNQSVLTGGNTGVVIRTQNPHGKIIQTQHSPGAQFLSPNSHIMMNSPTFSGQLSPLIANVSPTSVNFTSPHQVRSANIQQHDLMQCNQMGQTLMVPLSSKQPNVTSRNGSTFVQQNTTIVQHQTTLVSNSAANNLTQNVTGSGNRLSIDPTVLFNHNNKQKSRSMPIGSPPENIPLNRSNNQEKFPVNFPQAKPDEKAERVEQETKPTNIESNEFNQLLIGQQGVLTHVRHSVSTQTLASQQSRSPPVPVYSSSPPDTTTHSPLGPLEQISGSPRVYSASSMSMQGNYADTTTKSPEPLDSNSSAMVQCVSSSEPDVPEPREGGGGAWLPSPHAPPLPPPPASHTLTNTSTLGMIGGAVAPNRSQRAAYCSVESSENPYSQTISASSVNNQHSLTITPTGYCDRTHKRKANFEPPYRHDKIMRSGFNMEDRDADSFDKTDQEHKTDSHYFYDDQQRRNSHENEPKVEETPSNPESDTQSQPSERKPRQFSPGEIVWGPAKGYPSWPGKLVSQEQDGRWLLRWFGGDKSTSVLAGEELLTLSEGLEANHAARTKCRKSRKLNSLLEKAIQEAMSELDKRVGAGEGRGVGRRRRRGALEQRQQPPPAASAPAHKLRSAR